MPSQPPLTPAEQAYLHAIGNSPQLKTDGTGLQYPMGVPVFHQPLVQVRVRVVEVARNDTLRVASILDFVGQPPGEPTLIKVNNINGNFRNISGGTRFLDLPVKYGSNITDGAGALVNLTTGNINNIIQMLAQEFQGDIVTAPEVVTLNGQNVEFVAGQKIPFELGHTTLQADATSVQRFFYKHVGTYISVTPMIVNWGKHSEMRGKVPVTDVDIPDWGEFLRAVHARVCDKLLNLGADAELPKLVDTLVVNRPTNVIVPLEVKQRVLDALSRYSRDDLIRLGLPIVCSAGCNDGCSWRPEDCTIDLALVARISETGNVNVTPDRGGGLDPRNIVLTTENNVRAIANIVQVKSGHGAVIGGLIGTREVDAVQKVPVLGDLPVIGWAFRSKATERQKTEVLVFVEARVLDSRHEVARMQSAQNFQLSLPYVMGDLLDNPLERGMYRAGFGGYLPPHSKEEQIYWERLGRKVRKICTTFDDILE